MLLRKYGVHIKLFSSNNNALISDFLVRIVVISASSNSSEIFNVLTAIHSFSSRLVAPATIVSMNFPIDTIPTLYV